MTRIKYKEKKNKREKSLGLNSNSVCEMPTNSIAGFNISHEGERVGLKYLGKMTSLKQVNINLIVWV